MNKNFITINLYNLVKILYCAKNWQPMRNSSTCDWHDTLPLTEGCRSPSRVAKTFHFPRHSRVRRIDCSVYRNLTRANRDLSACSLTASIGRQIAPFIAACRYHPSMGDATSWGATKARRREDNTRLEVIVICDFMAVGGDALSVCAENYLPRLLAPNHLMDLRLPVESSALQELRESAMKIIIIYLRGSSWKRLVCHE